MSCDLLSRLQSEPDEEQLVDFILHIVYSTVAKGGLGGQDPPGFMKFDSVPPTEM